MRHENEGGYVKEYDAVTSDSKNSMEFNLNSKEDLNAKMGELGEEMCLEFNEDINNEKNTDKKEEMNAESRHDNNDDNKKCIINNKCNNGAMNEYSKYSYSNDDNCDEDNDELFIEMAKNGISSNENSSKLPLLLWDDNIKSKLKNKIYQTSRKMYLKYGNDGNCFNNFDYIPYFCNNHNIYFSNNKSEYSNMDNIDNAIFESKSCSDCKLSILDNFIKVIVDTIDKHIEFPPTIQRICELLCYPDCYTNTKSFLYALDKLVCVSIPINVNIDDIKDSSSNHHNSSYYCGYFSSDTNDDNYFDLDLNINNDSISDNCRNSNNGDNLDENNNIFESILDGGDEINLNRYKDEYISDLNINNENGCDSSSYKHYTLTSSSPLFSPLLQQKSTYNINDNSVCSSNGNVLPSSEVNCKKRPLPFRDEYGNYNEYYFEKDDNDNFNETERYENTKNNDTLKLSNTNEQKFDIEGKKYKLEENIIDGNKQYCIMKDNIDEKNTTVEKEGLKNEEENEEESVKEGHNLKGKKSIQNNKPTLSYILNDYNLDYVDSYNNINNSDLNINLNQKSYSPETICSNSDNNIKTEFDDASCNEIDNKNNSKRPKKI